MKSNQIVVFYCDLIIKKGEQHFCKGGLGCFLDEISKRYEKILFCAPVKEDDNADNLYQIKSQNIVFQALPPFNGFISAIKKRGVVLSAIKNYSKEWDCPVYLRWPTPFVYNVYKIARKNGLSTTLHIVGDSKTIINSSGKYRGPIKFAANLYVNLLEKQLTKIIKTTPVLINGNGLKRLYEGRKYRFVKEIRSATLSLSDIDENHLQSNKARKLLYVGVLKSEKGISYLLDAVKQLISKNPDITLTIVGDGPERKTLEKKAEMLNLSKHVTFAGYIPLGDSLLDVYKQHDIFVLPSVSEGTPRVLLEAMANKLAVVATNVGGIPYTVNNYENGILIDAKSSSALADAIEMLINNDALRNRIITNGFGFAKENTLEKFVDVVCDTIDGQNGL